MTSEEGYFPLPPELAPAADDEPRKKCPRSLLITFFSCLAVVVLGKMLQTPLVTLIGCDDIDYLLILILICGLLTLVVIILLFMMASIGQRGCVALCLLGFLLSLVLPLGAFYESARFAVLRPLREHVATEIAKSYQDKGFSDVVGYTDVKTEYPAWLLNFLARGGHVYCQVDRKNTRVFFLRSDNSYCLEYEVFLTDIPYRGPDPGATSDGYNYSLSGADRSPRTSRRAHHWLTYTDPYAELL